MSTATLLAELPVHTGKPETHDAFGVRILPFDGPPRLRSTDKGAVFLTTDLARAIDVARGCVDPAQDAQVVRLEVTVVEIGRFDRLPRWYTRGVGKDVRP